MRRRWRAEPTWVASRGCVGVCFVSVAIGGEVDAEGGFGADEGGVETVESVGGGGDGLRVGEAGESVAAPARQVHGVERDVGPVVGRIGEGFALRGGTRSSHPHPNHSPQRLDIHRGIRPRDAGG
jgi:hypothetical protein